MKNKLKIRSITFIYMEICQGEITKKIVNLFCYINNTIFYNNLNTILFFSMSGLQQFFLY